MVDINKSSKAQLLSEIRSKYSNLRSGRYSTKSHREALKLITQREDKDYTDNQKDQN